MRERPMLRTIAAASRLRIGRATLVGPAVHLRCVGAPPAQDRDVAAGLSLLVWRSVDEMEPWRRLRPLPRPVRGHPDPRRAWVVLHPSVREDDPVLTSAGLDSAQFHRLSVRNATSRDVIWVPTSRCVSGLLQQAEAVVAPSGPLAWDALRLGVRRLAPSGRDVDLARERECLGGVVPHPLVLQPAFWSQLLEDVARDDWSGWGSERWMARATAALAEERSGFAITRKLRKLERSPESFFADSSWSLARSFGHYLRARSERSPTRQVRARPHSGSNHSDHHEPVSDR